MAFLLPPRTAAALSMGSEETSRAGVSNAVASGGGPAGAYVVIGAVFLLFVGAAGAFYWPGSLDFTVGVVVGVAAGWDLWRTIPVSDRRR